MPLLAGSDEVERIADYHEQTKHHLDAYARSLGFLDWASQPDPFRRYDGATALALDEVPPTPEPRFDALFDGAPIASRALDGASVSQLLYDALALSAWKEYGANRWSLRVNPSSGNLHPTEGWVLAPAVPGLTDAPFVAHYDVYRHALEKRADLPQSLFSGLPPHSLLVGLTSIHWREAWKYGERAYRYCQHDAGHALAALAISAAALGWRAVLLENVDDDALATLFGIAAQQGPGAEHPDALVLVCPRDVPITDELRRWSPGADLLRDVSSREYAGVPNTLSREHQPWPIIDEAAHAARRTGTAPDAIFAPLPPPVPRVEAERELSARTILRQRRSAVSMDRRTTLAAREFRRLLARTLPSRNEALRALLPWSPRIHLALFVHRVEGLAPGLYLLARDDAAEPELRAAITRPYEWTRPADAPGDPGLWQLAATDARDAAKLVSCHQDIAADGAFAVAMLARFDPSLRELGAWFYRRLHWEAGVVGQQLYLEAEAAGVRGTGIGCFFDDAMHSVLGLDDRRFQTLYHFTIGGAVEDPRLRTTPAYAHLAR